MNALGDVGTFSNRRGEAFNGCFHFTFSPTENECETLERCITLGGGGLFVIMC